MLSDREREALDGIDRRFVIEDPLFARAFDLKARRLGMRGARVHRAGLTVLLVLALLMSGLMVVVHAGGPALLFTAVACFLIWLRHGHRVRDGHPGP